jgi:hypothetical protein
MANAFLQTLPCELLYRILKNLDAKCIIVSFRYVCKRFYVITTGYDQYELDLGSISRSSLTTMSRIIQPENITSLIFHHDSHQSIDIEFFFSLFDISRFTRLRSITLGNLSSSNDSSYLNRLAISHLITFNIHKHNACVCNALDFVLRVMALPTLRKLNLMELHDRIAIRWSLSYSIVNLRIQSCSFDEYDLILQRLPNLETFVMAEFEKSESDTPITASSTRHQHLLSLMIGDSSLSMNDFEQVLSLTPSLVTLKLISYRKNLDSISNGSDWAHLIQTKLPCLETFQFFFSYNLKQGNDAKDLDLLVDQFRSPFWLNEKKWIITCDYFIKHKLINIYTTPKCLVNIKEGLESNNVLEPVSLVMRFTSSSMDNDFHPIIQIMYIINDVAESKVWN